MADCRIYCVLIFILSIFVCDLTLAQQEGPMCMHDPEPVRMAKRIKTKGSRTSPRILSPAEKMKFQVIYDDSLYTLPSSISTELKGAVEEVIERVSRTLSVKRPGPSFLYPRSCVNSSITDGNGTEYCVNGGCAPSYCGPALVPESIMEPCRVCDVIPGNTANDTTYNCTTTGGASPEDVTRLEEGAHFILFVTSGNLSCPSGVIAYAGPCIIDFSIDNRPLVGFMNVCPFGLEFGRESSLSTIQHELFHALGFSSGLFAFYHNENGDPLTPRDEDGYPPYNYNTSMFQWSDRVVRSTELEWEHANGISRRTVTGLVLPNVLREARAHFGCPSLEVLELEDDGGPGSMLSHFEMRVLAPESMNAYISPGRVFSRMSLALMEDTGWYKPDYDLADNLNWGKGLGCDFVQRSCKWWIDNKTRSGESIEPWCNVYDQKSCHSEGFTAGTCTIFPQRSPIPPEFQYFPSAEGINASLANQSYIGGIPLMEYCPYYYASLLNPLSENDTALYCTNEEIVNDCRNMDCANDGVCVDIVGGFYCKCPQAYSGALCEFANTFCNSSEDCRLSELCSSAGECVCARGRTRDGDGLCVVIQEYTLTLTITDIDGQPAVFNSSINGAAGQGMRDSLEFEVHRILSTYDSLRPFVLDVVTKRFYSGSIIAEVGIIMNSTFAENSSAIDTAVTGTVGSTGLLNAGVQAFTVMTSSIVVQDADECSDSSGNDCSLNASCINTAGSFECTCLVGFADSSPNGSLPGRYCTNIDDCAPNPCQNGATCQDRINGYVCACAAGYEGTDCEIDIDDCSPDPCLNDAICLDQVDSYRCVCVTGFEGDDCEFDVNECTSTYLKTNCSRNATCINLTGSYNCQCADGLVDDWAAASLPGRVCIKQDAMTASVVIALLVCFGFLLGLLVMLACLLYYIIQMKRRRLAYYEHQRFAPQGVRPTPRYYPALSAHERYQHYNARRDISPERSVYPPRQAYVSTADYRRPYPDRPQHSSYYNEYEGGGKINSGFSYHPDDRPHFRRSDYETRRVDRPASGPRPPAYEPRHYLANYAAEDFSRPYYVSRGAIY